MKRQTATVATYYWLSWSGVLSLGFLLTLLSGLLHPLTAVIGLVLSLWIIFAQAFYRMRSYLPPLAVLFIFALIAWSGGIFYYIKHGDFIPLAGSILVGLLPGFIYRRMKAFGVWMAFLSLSLLALMSVIVAGDLSEYIFFIFFLISIVFNLNAANLVQMTGVARSSLIRLPERYFKQFGPSIFWGLFVAVLVFLLFPRSPTISNPFGFREKGVSTGYSGAVQLKSQSDMNISSALAFTVETLDVKWLESQAENLYFRGNSVDFFDGQTWISSDFNREEMQDDTDLRFTINYDLHPKRLKIYREPHNTKAVIYPNVLMEITAPLALIGGLFVDADRNLMRGHKEVIRYSYEVLVSEPQIPGTFSTVSLQRVIDVLKDPGLPHPLPSMPDSRTMAKYLRLPFKSGESNYFSKWVEEVGIDPKKVTFAKAIEILRNHFAKKFLYTTNYKFNDENAFEAFLTKERKGHCEYFATAAALYFRSLGIPSRVVLGYRGGSFNKLSKTLDVKEANAHAWVESYFPGSGWTTFDTTPAAVEPEMSKMEAYATLYLGAARFWANRYMVNYNNMTQISLIRTLAGQGAVPWWKFKLPDHIKLHFKEWVFGFLLCFSLFWAWRARAFRERKSYLPKYYVEFLDKIATKGFVRRSAETYGAFHSRLRIAGIDSHFLSEIDLTLERDLYSPVPTSDTDHQKILKNLKTLR